MQATNNDNTAHRVWRTAAVALLIGSLTLTATKAAEPSPTRTAVPITAEALEAIAGTVDIRTYYDCPLPLELQDYITDLCSEEDIDPAVVIGLIKKESGYKTTAKGDGGKSLGLMQIQGKWHRDIMAELEIKDMLDPYDNIKLGVRILRDHLDRYDGNMSKALMAYNAGTAGARKAWFSKGIYSNSYSRAVLRYAAELRADAYEMIG